jgi:hypothetical protein
VQQHIDFHDTMPLDELVIKLDTISLSAPKQRTSGASQVSARSAGALDAFEGLTSSEIEANYAAPQRRGPGPNNEYFEGDCRYCSRYGHRERDCYSRKRDDNIKRSYGGRGRFSGEGRRGSDFRDDHNNRGNSGQYSDNNNTRNRGHNNNRQDADVHNAYASIDDLYNGHQFEQFYGQDTDANTLSASLNTVATSPLLRIDTDVRFTQIQHVRVEALIDNGSSHSFIAPRMLLAEDLRWFDRSPGYFQSQPLSINGVTGLVTARCVMAEAYVQIGAWRGKHTFIVSTAMNDHEAILGLDFLRKFKVSIQHDTAEPDQIRIEDTRVYANMNNTNASIQVLPTQISTTFERLEVVQPRAATHTPSLNPLTSCQVMRPTPISAPPEASEVAMPNAAKVTLALTRAKSETFQEIKSAETGFNSSNACKMHLAAPPWSPPSPLTPWVASESSGSTPAARSACQSDTCEAAKKQVLNTTDEKVIIKSNAKQGALPVVRTVKRPKSHQPSFFAYYLEAPDLRCNHFSSSRAHAERSGMPCSVLDKVPEIELSSDGEECQELGDISDEDVAERPDTTVIV